MDKRIVLRYGRGRILQNNARLSLSPTWRNAAPMCRFALRDDCVQVATTLFYYSPLSD
ncbi:MAG: hypothetical protein SOY91_08360 [Candidatus Onthomorpha sp.]|nr:hypothetical protein [Candidatus Onthomorpha sp.]